MTDANARPTYETGISSGTNLVILGFGGHARSIADVAFAAGWRNMVFLDPNARKDEDFCSYLAVKEMPLAEESNWLAFPAAGENHRRRKQLQDNIMSWATLISPRGQIGIGSTISEATLVAHGAHVGPGAKIGRGVILNTHSIIEHEVEVGDFTHISVNAVVAGRSKIGSNVFLGAGAVVIDSVTVCSDVVIGAGAVVTDSIDEPGVYVGVPARRVK